MIRRNAPHLDRLCHRFEGDFPRILAGEAETIIRDANVAFAQAMASTRDEDSIIKAVRDFRMKVNHVVAITDYFDLAPVETHLGWLSDTAETAIDAVAQWLCDGHPLGEKMHEGWIILALGKLGSRELNYSSDVDLIVLTLPVEGEDRSQDYIRMTKRLVSILSQPSRDGIGWRVDLRLRPDPGATPVAMRLDAAISYYEAIARTWERAAFIRARPVAGNRGEGQQFLDIIQPFIWRRHLDYTVLEDMKVMLRREGREDHCLGYNVKNGMGGIRAIEFFIHVHQLIAGGREQHLRVPGTQAALDALTGHWITPEQNQLLKGAYYQWRRLEHRLQMIGDAQTHQLPRSEEQMAALAELCGHASSASFRAAVLALGDAVLACTSSLVDRITAEGDHSSHAEEDPLTVWLADHDADDTEAMASLTDFGFSAPGNILPVIRSWMEGQIAATRSDRARGILLRLLPRLLRSLGETGTPDQAFGHFAMLMDRLPAGVQMLSLLESHTGLVNTIIRIFSASPKLAAELARHPEVVDSLMYPSFWEAEQDWAERQRALELQLDRASDFEEKLNIIRRIRREWEFQAGAHLLNHVVTPQQAGLTFSRIADCIINAILPHVAEDMIPRFGRMDEGGLTVLALGRLGAETMTITSDLDLVFIYDAPEDAHSTGGRPVPARQWYARFGQQLINALTAPTSEGRCYTVDMRLRPSGNAGPVAVQIDSFQQYHLNDAWLWEHMALIKARPVAGLRDLKLRQHIMDFITLIIRQERKVKDVVAETTTMRDRVKAAFPATSPLDLRHCPGGLMDADFLVQMLQMMPAAARLPVISNNISAIPFLHRGGLLGDEEAVQLKEALSTLDALHQWLRLSGETGKDGATRDLSAVVEAFDLDGREALVGQIEQRVSLILTLLENRLKDLSS